MQILLLGYAFERSIIVEAKVASVEDVVGFCVPRKLIELAQIAWASSESPPTCSLCSCTISPLTSAMHNTLA